jgi:ABC-type multidrug transport system fused ATPase/permease subunit
MSEVTGKAFDLQLLRRIMAYARPYKRAFVGALILTILTGVLATARPILIKYTIDHFVMVPDPRGLLQFTLIMVGLLLLETAGQFGFIYLANELGQNIIRDLRAKLYRHILSLKVKFFDGTPIGTLVTRAVSDLETVAEIFAEGLLVIFSDLFKIGVMVVAMFWYFDWKLVVISLSVVPILYYATRMFQKGIKKSFNDVRNQVANLNSFVNEHLMGITIVQIFNREKAELGKFETINALHRDANIKSIWYFSIFFPVIEITSAISIGLVVWYGGLKAAEGTGITLGDLTAMILFVNMMFRPLRQLADRFNTLQMGMVASERVLKLLDRHDQVEVNGTSALKDVQGEVEFKNVVFGYKEGEPILKGVSFKIPAGQKLAIVGATGAGKSTMINLLNRFYDIWDGEILLDGTNVKDLTLDSLRNSMALVLQDVFLFSDSIHNNLTLSADQDETTLRRAAKLIGIEEFIDSLPEGFQYNVKERGASLSLGQRQLLAFLRAYLANPRILILDEATANIDSQTEALLQRATDELTQGRTSIIIAHRLSTIQKADQILVMDQGLVVERGTHAELLQQGGTYARLYETQFKTEEAE